MHVKVSMKQIKKKNLRNIIIEACTEIFTLVPFHPLMLHSTQALRGLMPLFGLTDSLSEFHYLGGKQAHFQHLRNVFSNSTIFEQFEGLGEHFSLSKRCIGFTP